MRLINPGARELSPARRASWFDTTYATLRDSISVPTVVGVFGGLLLAALLLIPPLPWDFRLPLYLVALIWTILRPQVALYLMAICVPWGSLDYINVGSLRLDSADILVVFLVAGWLIQFVLPPRMQARVRVEARLPRYLVFAMLALLFVMLLSTGVAINVKDSLKEISKWIEVLAIFLLGSQYLRTRRQIWTLIALICLAGISQAIFGYLQAFLNLGPESFIRSSALRVYGTFDQPNPYAAYINMPLSIAIALALLGRGWLTRILAGVTAIMLLYAEILSQSRGGELALIAAAVFILFIGIQAVRAVMRLGIFVVLGVIAVALTGHLPSSLTDKAFAFLGLTNISLAAPSPQDYSTAERLAHWIAGINMFIANPILGVGIGNYPDAYLPFHVTIFVDPLGHAHNYYINVAAEMGLIGLTVYLLFVLAIFVAGGSVILRMHRRYKAALAMPKETQQPLEWPIGTQQKARLLLHPIQMLQDYRRQRPVSLRTTSANDRALAIGLVAALVTVAVHNLVDDVYVHSLTNLIALLLIALIRLERVTPDLSKKKSM
jgi:O-antigen ligase